MDQNTDQTPGASSIPTEDTQSSTTMPAASPVSDTPATTDTDSYIENTGGSLIDVLREVNDSQENQQKVATEMQIPVERLKTLLSGILAKIDQGQLTQDELSLLMTAPIIDDELFNPQE